MSEDRVLDLRNIIDDKQLSSMMITGIMCYSGDMKKLRRWQIRNILAIVAEKSQGIKEQDRELGCWLGENLYPLGGWKALRDETLLSNKKGHQHFNKETRAHWVPGLVAGLMLKSMTLDDTSTTIGEAADKIVSKEVQNYFTDKGKLPPYGNFFTMEPERRNAYIINKIWPKYKAAAHLWAALAFKNIFETHEKHVWLPLEHHKLGFDGFLQLADKFRLKALKVLPPRGRRKKIFFWQITY